MQVVLLNRNGGKTGMLIGWFLADPGRVILTSDEDTAEMILRRVMYERKEWGSDEAIQLRKRILSFTRFKNQRSSFPHGTEIGVDAADYILEQFLGTPIHIVTMTFHEQWREECK